MLLGSTSTLLLNFVPKGNWTGAVLLFILGNIGFAGGNVLYDSLLLSATSKNKSTLLSAFGYALGYLGGGLLFAFQVWMTLSPTTFGLENAAEAVKVSFFLTGIWWAFFSLPLFLWLKEKDVSNSGKQPPSNQSTLNALGVFKDSFLQIKKTTLFIFTDTHLGKFLLAYWLYIDGVHTITIMSVDYGMSLGLEQKDLITAILLTQFISFPCAWIYGWIGQKTGEKAAILFGILGYTIITFFGIQMKTGQDFMLLAIAVGVLQGGIPALSRSFYSKHIPANQDGEYFGYYSVVGKFAAVLGPLLIGFMSAHLPNPRYSLLSLLILFGFGAFLLIKTPSNASAQE